MIFPSRGKSLRTCGFGWISIFPVIAALIGTWIYAVCEVSKGERINASHLYRTTTRAYFWPRSPVRSLSAREIPMKWAPRARLCACTQLCQRLDGTLQLSSEAKARDCSVLRRYWSPDLLKNGFMRWLDGF